MLLVAWGTFGILSYLQEQQAVPAITKWGTIDPDISIDEAINHIKQLPPSPEFTANSNSWVNNSWENMEINLEQMMWELINMNDTHNIATPNYWEQNTQLCSQYSSTCNIISLDGTYTAQQQFAYQLMVIYVINRLESFNYDPLFSLKSITINNYTQNRRWYANAKLIVLNTYQMSDYKEFLQVLVHEMGHVIDLGNLTGTSSQINPDYTEFGKKKFAADDQSLAFYAISWSNENTLRSRMSNQDFVSGYGMSNPFEDFAESHNMYLYHRDVFAYMTQNSTILQQKYQYFDTLYKTRKLSANFNPTDLTTVNTNYRPWDSTRM